MDKTNKIIAFTHTVKNITDRKKTEEALKESEEKYRELFENFPVSLWEEDFSRVKSFIDDLKSGGVANLREYFESHPEEVYKCATLVEIVSINDVTVRSFEGRRKEDILGNLDRLFVDESLGIFKEEILALEQGRSFKSEIIGKTIEVT